MNHNFFFLNGRSGNPGVHRFLKFLVVALVFAGAMSPANAVIVFYNLPTPVTATTGDSTKDIGNISLAGTYDYSGTAPHFTFHAENDIMFGGAYVWMAGDNSLSLAKDGSGYIAKIDASTSIDGSWANWTAGFHNPTLTSSGSGPWTGGATDYVGLRISNTGNYYYGWASVTYDAGSISMTVSNFAFENTANTAISAGDTGVPAVPEPASGALVMVGAFGIAACRHRRRETRVTREADGA
ncbi:MAG: PEP-CTERM sorting domain-containing protein [Verrucomicrobia bacterium]|nr:PEP-CTERM sorting domain-containing protein [Verrucomicrobiota bacterium]